MLPIGATAPDFTLRSHTGQTVSLGDFRGKRHVVLAFHPLAFTPVCSVQMQTYQRDLPKYDAAEAHILSLSVDAGPAKKAWAQSLGGISYDLLSDFHPHGHVASLYGVMREDGISERATFIINKAGTIVWAKKYDIPQQPDHDEVLEALKSITSAQ